MTASASNVVIIIVTAKTIFGIAIAITFSPEETLLSSSPLSFQGHRLLEYTNVPHYRKYQRYLPWARLFVETARQEAAALAGERMDGREFFRREPRCLPYCRSRSRHIQGHRC